MAHTIKNALQSFYHPPAGWLLIPEDLSWELKVKLSEAVHPDASPRDAVTDVYAALVEEAKKMKWR